jgi:hypothetical protein
MRYVQVYRQNGRLVRRVYKKRPGRPKGIKNSSYNLSAGGLKVKQEVGRKQLLRLHKEGKAGSGFFRTHEYPDSAREKNSKSILKLIADGKFDPADNIRKFIAAGGSKNYWATRVNHGTHGMFFSRKNGKKLRYDSSWELKRMQCLEKEVKVVSYKKNPVQIPYSLNGIAHYYWPDFLVEYKNGTHVLEEIKPKALLNLPKNKLKLAAAKMFCKAAKLKFRVLSSVEQLGTI